MRAADRLILFDIDCTLLWTGGAGRESTRRAMLDVFGQTGALDDHNFGGKTDWQTLHELLHPHGIDHATIADAMPAYVNAMGRHLAEIIDTFPVRCCPSALDVVEAARRAPRTLIGLVTGNVESAAHVKLRAAGFDPAWFPIGAYGHEAFDRNDLTGLAARRAQTYIGHRLDAQRIYVVGDTPMDIACARAIDAVAIAVGTGFGSRDDLIAAGPDHFFEDIGGMLVLLADD